MEALAESCKYSRSRGNIQQALDTANAALRLDPADTVPWLLLRQIHELREITKAVADTDKLVDLEPWNESWYLERALMQAKRGKIDEALKDCQKAIKLAPTSPDAYIARGRVQRLGDRSDPKRDYAKALADFKKAVELAPKYHVAHNYLAWFYATAPNPAFRDGKKAVEHAKIACELTGWKDHSAVDTYAAALAETGDFKQAVRWQTEAIRLCGFAEADLRDYKYRERLQLYQSGKKATHFGFEEQTQGFDRCPRMNLAAGIRPLHAPE
jgi:tetratricopeptide (TPR) repeat protein